MGTRVEATEGALVAERAAAERVVAEKVAAMVVAA